MEKRTRRKNRSVKKRRHEAHGYGKGKSNPKAKERGREVEHTMREEV
jgi:hypothetical protein